MLFCEAVTTVCSYSLINTRLCKQTIFPMIDVFIRYLNIWTNQTKTICYHLRYSILIIMQNICTDLCPEPFIGFSKYMKLFYNAFCVSRQSCMKSAKCSQVMSLESTFIGLENKNKKWFWGVDLEKSELISTYLYYIRHYYYLGTKRKKNG